MLPEKGCAFLCFADPVGADLFYQNTKLRPLQIDGMEIKVGLAKSSPVNPSMQQAIQQGVSRNVFINRLDPGMDTAYLTSALPPFGEIEMINILQEMGTGNDQIYTRQEMLLHQLHQHQQRYACSKGNPNESILLSKRQKSQQQQQQNN